MISLRSLLGLVLSLLVHVGVGAYFLSQDFKEKTPPPKPNKVAMQLDMFKVEPKPIIVAPKPEQPTQEPVKVVEPTPEKPKLTKSVVKPKPVVKPRPKIKKKAKQKPKPKAKPKKKKPVAKPRPAVKPRKVAQPKRPTVQKRPVQHRSRPPVKRPPVQRRVVKPRPVRKPVVRPVAAKVTAKKAVIARPAARPKAAGNPQLEGQYGKSIRQIIEQKKTYPRRAKKRNKQGVVKVAFSVDKNGSVSKLRVVQSSGSKILDQAALKAVKKVGRFPAIPAGIGKQFLDYVVPIAYRLR